MCVELFSSHFVITGDPLATNSLQLTHLGSMQHRAEQKSCTGDSTVRIKWFMSRLPGKAREDVNSILRQKSLGN